MSVTAFFAFMNFFLLGAAYIYRSYEWCRPKHHVEMNRAYWTRIQRSFPQALAQCIEYFKRSSTQWRQDIQNPNKLVQFFTTKHIDLIITKARSTYGYEVRTKLVTIKMRHRWTERPNAIWWGLYSSFMTLEQELVGQLYHEPYTKSDPVRKRSNGDGPGWGERMQKDKDLE